MNWPQFLLPSPILITIARVNYYKAERRKWVQGIQMQGLMGWDGNWAAEVDAHRLSSGGYWRNLLVEEEFSTWNNCHSLCLHCAPDCRSTAGKMKQELTEAPNANADLCTYKRTHTQAHTICIYRHVHTGELMRELRHAHTYGQSLPECVLFWPSGPF